MAAVRGGAILLEAVAPSLAASYRRVFMTGAAGDGNRAFEREYPLDSGAESALRAAAARYSTTQSSQE